jgi:TnpA family transposase
MPRRAILSPAERADLFSFPEDHDELIRYYTFSEADLSLVRQHRGPANRLGFAVQLCCMRHPGITLSPGETPAPALL